MATTGAQYPLTILFVQGSFQIPQVYDKLTQGLESQGYPTLHPSLPSCSDTESVDFPQRSLVDDAATIRTALDRLVKQEGKAVLLVMHSYGGLVGSEAVTEELSYSKRQDQGLPGGVIHLFFYAAFLLKEGQSVLGAFGESPNNDVKPDGRFMIQNGDQTLYNDLPPSVASFWASRLVVQSYKVQTTELTHAAWRYVPSTYLICENDQAAPPQYQGMFAATAGAHIERCSSGHSPHLSQPEMLVGKIHDVAQDVIARSSQSHRK